MKKILLLLIACVFISINVQAQVTGISLNCDDVITLNVGEDTTLVVTFDPLNAPNKTVIWETDKDDVVRLDTATNSAGEKICVVTGETDGEVIIKVTSEDGNRTATCTVRVVQPVAGMILNENTMNLILERDTILLAEISPSKATDKTVKWVSRDSSIVNIESTDENRCDTICRIIAVKPGTTWIVAETVDGGFKDSCEVTVASALIENFTLDNDSIEIIIGVEATIIAQIRPLEETYKYIRWTNTNFPARDIIEITSSGYDTICKIIAKGVGEAKIIAEAYDGQKDTCVIIVKGIPVEGMSLSNNSLVMNLNSDTVIMAIINPHYATNDSIEWISTDSATVDIISSLSAINDTICEIKALSSGTAKIMARTKDGGFVDSCTVTVIVPVDSVVIKSELMVIGEDERVHMNLKDDTVAVLIAKIFPDSATNKSLIWSNFDENLAKIDLITDDTICYIKALSAGVDTIIASANGIVSRPCFIVIAPREVDSVKIDKGPSAVNDTIQMFINGSFELITTVYPFNATNDSLKIESNNPEVARIDSTSNSVSIKALKEGLAIVYVSPMDGNNGKKDSCIIEVKNLAVSGITLNKDTIYVYEQSIDSVIARITPLNASNDSIVWTSSKPSVEIQSSTGYDSICSFKGLVADTVLIFAVSKEDSSIKDSCVVIVRERFVFFATNTATADGIIGLSIVIPDGVTFTGASFELQLPKGFGLTKGGNGYKTSLTNEAQLIAGLYVTYVNDSTYIFNLTPKTALTYSSMLRSGTLSKVMDIYYTIYDNSLVGNSEVFDAVFKNITINLSNATTVNEEHIVKIIVYKDQTGNVFSEDSPENSAYVIDRKLYVNSDRAETVYVYSLNGSLIYMGNKAEGQAVFNINTQEKVLVIKGSSGWNRKIFNR